MWPRQPLRPQGAKCQIATALVPLRSILALLLRKAEYSLWSTVHPHQLLLLVLYCTSAPVIKINLSLWLGVQNDGLNRSVPNSISSLLTTSQQRPLNLSFRPPASSIKLTSSMVGAHTMHQQLPLRRELPVSSPNHHVEIGSLEPLAEC